VKPEWQLETVLLPVKNPSIIAPVTEMSDEEILQQIIRHAYDIAADDWRLRETMRINSEERGHYFDALRRDYPVRREFYNYEIALGQGNQRLLNPLKALGFRV
jgi:erythronate-4-phosphate dehydrogenase